jgi:hypothetical protein
MAFLGGWRVERVALPFRLGPTPTAPVPGERLPDPQGFPPTLTSLSKNRFDKAKKSGIMGIVLCEIQVDVKSRTLDSRVQGFLGLLYVAWQV